MSKLTTPFCPSCGSENLASYSEDEMAEQFFLDGAVRPGDILIDGRFYSECTACSAGCESGFPNVAVLLDGRNRSTKSWDGADLGIVARRVRDALKEGSE